MEFLYPTSHKETFCPFIEGLPEISHMNPRTFNFTCSSDFPFLYVWREYSPLFIVLHPTIVLKP
ncbi:hypothetical protein SDJN02_09291, partial [Cucurbita argyrosperma subsp. argyrosperma]